LGSSKETNNDSLNLMNYSQVNLQMMIR